MRDQGRVVRCSCYLAVFLYTLFFSSFATAEIIHNSLTYQGYERQYEIYLPGGYRSGMPAVLVLHGYSQDVTFIRDYTGMNSLAEAEGFIAVYPSSVPPGWNVEYDHPALPLPNIDDVDFFSQLINDLYNRYSIDLYRVYCCGFSNGGDMTFRLAVFLPDRFAAVAGVSGVLTEKTLEHGQSVGTVRSQLRSSVPVLMIHGTADTWVPYDEASYNCLNVEDTMQFWLARNGCTGNPKIELLPDLDPADGSTVEKRVWSNCAVDTEVVFYKIIGGGHGWPGSSGKYAAQFGVTNRDIDACSEIWDFFKKY
jgi:polyhydroxybutyrate depolymerase